MKELDKSKFWIIRNNPIIKTGVFPYLGRQISPDLNPTQIYNVLRPEDELFNEKTINSFNMLPITIGHALLGSKEDGLTPPEEKGIEGTTGENAKRAGDKMTNTIKLYSERIKDEINNGKKELSAGYFCDFLPESGTYQGRRYDYVQRNIDGNHIALVDKGRNGHDVRVMDSAEGLQPSRQFVCDAMELGKIEEQEDLSSKNHGNSGQDAATGKENETMDKREIIREIMAVAAKPADQFQGGEEEREKTIAELAEKIAYNPSEAEDTDTEADPKDAPKAAEKDAEDKGAGCDADETEKTEKDEAGKKPASLDEMEKELLARLGRKAELVNKLTPIIGAFDSASMTEKEVAAYACEKLEIKAALDEAPAVLRGYLAGYKPAEKRVIMKSAQDEAVNTDVLNDFKEGK